MECCIILIYYYTDEFIFTGQRAYQISHYMQHDSYSESVLSQLSESVNVLIVWGLASTVLLNRDIISVISVSNYIAIVPIYIYFHFQM